MSFEEDTMTLKGASGLAYLIHMHWLTRGVKGVRVWIEPILAHERKHKRIMIYQIRSNIAEKLCIFNGGIAQEIPEEVQENVYRH